MKKLFIVCFILFICLDLQAQVYKTINLIYSNSLLSYLTENELKTITNLTVTGSFSSGDYFQLRSVTMPNLSIIDLSGAKCDGDSLCFSFSNGWSSLDHLGSSNNPVTVILPSTLKIISGIFQGCYLSNITFPSTLKIIRPYTFANCYVSSLIIPNSVTSGGDFSNMHSLETIKLSDSIPSISFKNCGKLTSVNIPNSVTSLGDYDFQNCWSLTSLIIPNSVTSIGTNTFDQCRALVSIKLPDFITSIKGTLGGTGCFSFCSSLKTITIPNSVTSIGSYVFWGSGLTSITIPNSVTSIGERIINNPSTNVTVKSTVPISLTSALSINALDTLFVPFGAKKAYQSANYWNNFARIVELKPYSLDDVNISSLESEFVVPINANMEVSNASGYDIILHYDTVKLRPILTDEPLINIQHGLNMSGSKLINPAAVDYTVTDNNGVIRISIFLNGSINTTFSGKGELARIAFARYMFIANERSEIILDSIIESYDKHDPVTVRGKDTSLLSVSTDLKVSISPFSICMGQAKQIDATVIGGVPPYSCSWSSINGTSTYPSLSSSVIWNPIFSATFVAKSIFILTVTAANGDEAKDTLEISVNANPKIDEITSQSNSLQACLSATNLGQKPYSHLWYVDNKLVSQNKDEQACSSLLLDVTKSGVKEVRYVLTDSFGCADSIKRSITVNNTAPKIKTIPDQEATSTKLFKSVYLPSYVLDETQFSHLTIKVQPNSVISGTVQGDSLKVEQFDKTWTGSTELQLEATDSLGASAQFIIRYIQPYLLASNGKLPTGSFFSNKVIVKPTDTVQFYATLSSTDTVEWNFNGGKMVSGGYTNPRVCFDKAGTYSIDMKVINKVSQVTVAKTNYIKTYVLSQTDTTLCLGDSITLSVWGSAYKSYRWNTLPEQTTPSIRVAPRQTTVYKVSVKVNALITITDSVKISIAPQPNLGKDTGICKSSALRLAPGRFKQYYWNGANEEGKSYFDATSKGTVSVKTVDSLHCIAYDTVSILTEYPLPIVDLGKDTVFCWKKTTVLDAHNIGAQYQWNGGQKSQTIIADTTRLYSVTVTDKNNCKNTDTIAIKVIVPPVPTISLITQSSENKNLIAWEWQKDTGVARYYVWRESIAADKFDVIDTVIKGEWSVSIDRKTNPVERVYRYALSSVDSACHNQSRLSVVHNSMYLVAYLDDKAQNPTVTVSWIPDHGLFSPIKTYKIYRAEKGSPLSLYDTYNVTDNNLYKQIYIDTKPIGLNSYYQVRYDLEREIVPSILKTDTGPFSQSFSNMSEASLVSESELVIEGVSIYPNPAKDEINITAANAEGAQVSLVAASGTVVTKTTIANGKAQFTVAGLAKGIYTIQLQTNDKAVSEQVVVE